MSKFVLVVVVIATIAAAALIGVGIYVNYPPSTSGTDAYAQALAAAAILVTTIVSGAVIYWLYRLFRWAITLLVSGVGLRDLPPLIILVSLTLAATLFASGATSIWYVAYDLLRVLFVQFPRSVVEIAFNAYLCGVRSSSDCGVQIVGNLANNVARFFTDSFNSLGRVIDILQFFSAWAILAWLLRDFFASADAPETTVGIRAVYRGMTPITRMQLGLAAVVAVGAYLCLCAIVAVSLFKPTERLQQIEPGRFEKQLDLAKLAHDGADSAFAKRFPEKLPDFPKSEQLQGPYYQQLASEYEELSVRWGQLRTEIASEQDRLRDIAADNYNIKNLNRVGDREQANYYLALESWYQKSLSSLFNYLEHCRTAILLVRIGSTADLTGSSPNAPASSDGGSGQASGPPRPLGYSGRWDLTPFRMPVEPVNRMRPSLKKCRTAATSAIRSVSWGHCPAGCCGRSRCRWRSLPASLVLDCSAPWYRCLFAPPPGKSPNGLYSALSAEVCPRPLLCFSRPTAVLRSCRKAAAIQTHS